MGNRVVVEESGDGPYAQRISAGRHVMAADEPETAGGHDSGASPYEFLMAGLGACTAMTLRMYAARQNWELGKITVEVRHKKVVSAGGDVKTDRFERDIRIDGGLTAEQETRLREIAEKCPVSLTLRNASLVETRVGPSGRARTVGEAA